MMIGGKYNYIGLESKLSMTLYTAPKIELEEQEANASAIAISNIKVRGKEESNYNNNVYFRDPLSNAYVQVGLSDENLDRLQNVFGRDSIRQDNNGNVLLKGEAEKFVSGWFGDIAYKRGYVQADTNQDGHLSIDERKNTHSFTLGTFRVEKSKNTLRLMGDDVSYLKFVELSAGNTERIERFSSSSIEAELNRTLERDKDADGSIIFGQVWDKENYTTYLDTLADNAENCEGYIPPSLLESFSFLKEMDESNKEMLKKELKKAGIDIKDISADMSAKEILRKLIEDKEGVKDSLETKSQAQENTDSVDPTFKEIQDLTKLDKETLKRNLENNPNFEDDIISIVQDITKSVDAKYFNTSGYADSAIKTSLEISA